MESFYKTLKVEEVHHENYETHEQAVRAANGYIERFLQSNTIAFDAWLRQSTGVWTTLVVEIRRG